MSTFGVDETGQELFIFRANNEIIQAFVAENLLRKVRTLQNKTGIIFTFRIS
jgi:hypothetical protein